MIPAEKASWLFVALAVVAGCQCLVPVDEADGGAVTGGGRAGGTSGGSAAGGSAGGSAGGGSAGGTTGCARASDCQGSTALLGSLCSGTPGAWSCALGSCVVECAGGRTCTATPTSQCLTCNGTQGCADAPLCPWLSHIFFERSTCGLSPRDLWATRLTPNPCERTLELPDAGVAGTLWAYGSGSIRAEIPALGGSCVGVVLPPDTTRFSLSCPACSAIVRVEIVGP